MNCAQELHGPVTSGVRPRLLRAQSTGFIYLFALSTLTYLPAKPGGGRGLRVGNGNRPKTKENKGEDIGGSNTNHKHYQYISKLEEQQREG